MSELRLHVRPALRDAPLLLAFGGWNDAGDAATLAVRYVEDAIRAVPLAEIDCEDFLDFTVTRPTVKLDAGHQRVIEWPSVTFRYGSMDGSRELVTGCGFEPHLRWRRFCDLIAELAATLSVQRVVLVGAFLADVVYSRPVGVTGFASDPRVLERIGVPASSYQGPTGILGVIAERLRRDGLEIVSLWAGLPALHQRRPEPARRAGAAAQARRAARAQARRRAAAPGGGALRGEDLGPGRRRPGALRIRPPAQAPRLRAVGATRKRARSEARAGVRRPGWRRARSVDPMARRRTAAPARANR